MESAVSDSKPRKTQPLGPLVRSGHIRLTVVSGPCPNGLSIGLGGSEHEIGRKNGDVILAEDLGVSVSHATLTKTKGRIEIADHSSNGTFLRVRGTAVVKAGDIIRTGNQLFRYDLVNPAESHPTADGTLLLTSPRRKGTFRLLQILEGGKPGLSATSSNNELTIGGEGSSIAFTSDAHLSTKHARLLGSDDGTAILEDLGSTNGTYLKISAKSDVTHGDYLYLGNTLLRVDLT